MKKIIWLIPILIVLVLLSAGCLKQPDLEPGLIQNAKFFPKDDISLKPEITTEQNKAEIVNIIRPFIDAFGDQEYSTLINDLSISIHPSEYFSGFCIGKDKEVGEDENIVDVKAWALGDTYRFWLRYDPNEDSFALIDKCVGPRNKNVDEENKKMAFELIKDYEELVKFYDENQDAAEIKGPSIKTWFPAWALEDRWDGDAEITTTHDLIVVEIKSDYVPPEEIHLHRGGHGEVLLLLADIFDKKVLDSYRGPWIS